MNPFFYFTNRTTEAISRVRIDDLGLGHAFRHNGGISNLKQIGSGTPSGSQGILFANQGLLGESKLGWWPDKQEAFAIPDEEEQPSGVWIIYDKESMPTPESLAYKKQLPGEWVTLGGQKWLIPIVKEYNTEGELFFDNLPQRTRRLGNGTYVIQGVVAEYQAIYQESVIVFNSLLEDIYESAANAYGESMQRKTEIIPFGKRADLVSRLIGLNYAVDVWEGSILGFGEAEGVNRALDAAFDMDAFVELLKKKLQGDIPDEENSPLGAEVSIPATAQASEN